MLDNEAMFLIIFYFIFFAALAWVVFRRLAIKNKENYADKINTVDKTLNVIVALGVVLIVFKVTQAYNDYGIASKVSEGMNLAGGARVAVSEYRLSKGIWPNDNTAVGLPEHISNERISAVVISGNRITLTYQNLVSGVDGLDLEMRAKLSSDGKSLEWTCGGGETTVDERLLPSGCRL